MANADVFFEVLPGTLADVRVNGESRVHAKLLTSAFADQVGKPVRRDDVESAMYLINDLPGLDAQGMFVAGEAVGASDLNLVARNERSWGAQVRVDNQGDDHTGSERVFVDGSWFDPTGRGDALSMGALATRNPENSYYGYLGYDTPLQGLHTRLHTRISRDEFDYSNGASEQNGTADTAELGVTEVLARSRTRSDRARPRRELSEAAARHRRRTGFAQRPVAVVRRGRCVDRSCVRSAANFDERPHRRRCGRLRVGTRAGAVESVLSAAHGRLGVAD